MNEYYGAHLFLKCSLFVALHCNFLRNRGCNNCHVLSCQSMMQLPIIGLFFVFHINWYYHLYCKCFTVSTARLNKQFFSCYHFASLSFEYTQTKFRLLRTHSDFRPIKKTEQDYSRYKERWKLATKKELKS